MKNVEERRLPESLNFMCIGEFVAFGLLDRAYRSERSYHKDEYNSQWMFCGKIGLYQSLLCPEAEFKEFEPRLKFMPWLKYGWFHLKLYSIFQDLNRRSIKTGFGRFRPRLKFIKFGHWKHRNLQRNKFLEQISGKIEYNFKWNQPYLSCGLNLSRGSNSLNSASDLNYE